MISRGRASVAELALAFEVTTETVRRDLAILDRAGLEERSCECYTVVRRAYDRLLRDADSRRLAWGGRVRASISPIASMLATA